jgi:hypothetical protein
LSNGRLLPKLLCNIVAMANIGVVRSIGCCAGCNEPYELFAASNNMSELGVGFILTVTVCVLPFLSVFVVLFVVLLDDPPTLVLDFGCAFNAVFLLLFFLVFFLGVFLFGGMYNIAEDNNTEERKLSL